MELLPIHHYKASVGNKEREIEISVSSIAERPDWVDYRSKPRYFVPCRGGDINTYLEKPCIPLHVVLPRPGGKKKVMMGFPPNYRKASLENQDAAGQPNIVLYSPPYSPPECWRIETMPLFFIIAVCAYLRVRLLQEDLRNDVYPSNAFHMPGYHSTAIFSYLSAFLSIVQTSQVVLELSRIMIFIDFWLLLCFFLEPELEAVLLITGQLLLVVLMKVRSRKSFFYTPPPRPSAQVFD